MNEGGVIAQGEPEVLLADKHVRKVYLGEQFTL
jgi:ABC-type lipopolysaccharide export system ATPase subunit